MDFSMTVVKVKPFLFSDTDTTRVSTMSLNSDLKFNDNVPEIKVFLKQCLKKYF